MKDNLNVDVETEFTQQLLDCSEDELRQSYLKMLTGKLDSWCANLITQEVKVRRLHMCISPCRFNH